MFKNKVVIVTGGSAGIGAATAELFAKEGASIAIVGRNEEKLNNVRSRCEDYGAETLVIKADVSKDEEANTIVEQTVAKFGKLDVLVNNAGILKRCGVLEDNIIETFDAMINTNLRSVILITKLATPHLTKTKGCVVNVSSCSSTMSPGKMTNLFPYIVSKAGLDLYTKGAAFELSSFGVRVNSVNPGPVATDMLRNVAVEMASGNQTEIVAHLTTLGRVSDTDEIAEMIMYLSSDKARGITGSCFVIDNGTLLK